MNNFAIIKEYLMNELIIINKKIEEVKNIQTEISKNLEILLTYQMLLTKDIEELDIDKMAEFIILLKPYDNLNDDISRLHEIKKISKFLINPKIPDKGVKKEAIEFLEYFKNKLKAIYVEFTSMFNEYNNNIKLYENEKIKDNSYLALFDSLGFKEGVSKQEINDFFDYLEKSQIDKNIVLEVVTYYTIQLLENKERQIKFVDLRQDTERKTDENSKNELSELKTKTINENVVLPLTEEEQKIINEVRKLVEAHQTEDYKKLFDIVGDLFKDFNIEIRKENYQSKFGIDWETIVADYYVNLQPNVNINRKEVLDIFRFIIEINEKSIVLSTNDENFEKQKEVFKEISKVIEEITNEYYSKHYMDNYNENNGTNSIIIELGEAKEETLYKLNKGEMNLITLEKINIKLRGLIEKYRNGSFEKTDDDLISVQNKNCYDLNTTKTIILLLRDKEGYFVPIEEVNKNDSNSLVREEELQKAIYIMSSSGMANNKKELRPNEVTHTDKNGKDKSLKDEYGFRVDRIRFTNDGRTGYVTVPVCEENRKKLMNIYGENIFDRNYNSIILIVASIFSNSSHAEYAIFKGLVDKNYNYIKYIIDIFNNPNVSIDDLRNIIEESAKECKNIGINFGRGGK